MTEAAQGIAAAAVGQLCWRARRGYGPFLTFDLGGRVVSGGREFGAWHLWVQSCDWRLLGAEGLLAVADDDDATIDRAVGSFAGKHLTDVAVDPTSLDATFAFEGDLSLEIGPDADGEPGDRWLLFTPDERVLVIDGATWSYGVQHEA